MARAPIPEPFANKRRISKALLTTAPHIESATHHGRTSTSGSQGRRKRARAPLRPKSTHELNMCTTILLTFSERHFLP
jgi:hypothetical protein